MRRLMLLTWLAGASLTSLGAVLAEEDQSGTSKPLLNQAQLVMARCADIWTIKNHDELDDFGLQLKGSVDSRQSSYETSIGTYPTRLKDAEAKVARLRKAWDDSLAKTVEDGAKTGLELTLSSAPQVAQALKTNAGNDADAVALREAESELAGLKSNYSYERAWLAGLPAFRTALETCLKDQRSYLGPRPNTIITPPSTETVAALKLTGTWTARCVNPDTNKHHDYRGTLVLDLGAQTSEKVGETEVTGTLDFETGSIPLKGKWTHGPDDILAEDTSLHVWKLRGKLAKPQGQYAGVGTLTAEPGPDAPQDNRSVCKGEFNGTQK